MNTRICDICSKETGIAYKSKDFSDRSDGIPVILLRDFDHSKYTEKNLINLNSYKKHIWVNEGDILISKTADVKLCIWEGKKSVLNQNAMKLSLIDKHKINRKYLLYFLSGRLEHIRRKLAGTTTTFVREGQIMNLQIPLPPLSEQEHMVDIFEKSDSLRKKRQEANRLMQTTAHSLFLNMFGDPILNKKEWSIKKIRDVIVNNPGNGYFAKKDQYTNTGKPIIWISDFIDKLYVDCTSLKRVRISEADLEKYKVKYGDILFCRSSLNFKGIGKAGVVPQNLPCDTIFECHIIKIKLDTTQIIPEFFKILSDTKYFRIQIEKKAQVATMTTIPQKGITDIEIILPPIVMQKKFAKAIKKIEELEKKGQESNKELDKLFNSFICNTFKKSTTF